MRRIWLGVALAALALVPWTMAAEKKNKVKVPTTTGVETKNVGPTIPSKVVAHKVAKLSEQIDWQFALDDAKSLARQQNKAVLWLHVLGKLDEEC
jgi:hypothetical protein